MASSRPRTALALLLAAALAGCMGPNVASPSRATDPGLTAAAPAADGAPDARPAGLAPPDVPVGRAWTYEVETGFTVPGSITVVVAAKSTEGYTFGAAHPEDLLGEAVHGVQWLGPHNRSLDDTDSTARVLDFPLVDGKTWALSPGRNLTAHARTVTTPAGDEDGFVIEGANHEHTWRFEYAPSVGYFVNYEITEGGAVEYRLHLTRVGMASEAYWLTGPLRAGAGGPVPDAATLDVPAAASLVYATAYVPSEADVALVPPPGTSPWVPAAGAAAIQSVVLPATAGTWALAAQPPPAGVAGIMAGAAHVEHASDLARQPAPLNHAGPFSPGGT